MSRRSVRWTRSLGQPMSNGGSPICDKHEFIEANSDDPEMAFEIAEAARAALEDGQNMERALKDRKDVNEGIQSELDWANEQISAMQRHAHRLRISQLRRMASISAGMSDDLFGYASHENAPRGSFLWRMARRKARCVRFRAACLAEIARLQGAGS